MKLKTAASSFEVCELAADGWSLGIAPSSGAIVWCAYEHCEILRRTSLRCDWSHDPFGFSHFPLAPYSNRIRDGRFGFGEKIIRIKPNAPGHLHPLHGTAWRGNWTFAAHSSNGARLEYIHRPDEGWPWAFSLAQEIKIERDALTIKLIMRNEADTPMPGGIGFHPYFSGPQTAALTFSAEGYWRPDEDGLPAEWRAAAGNFDFSGGRPLSGESIDQCFTGWRGMALIEWTDRPFGVEITADPSITFAVVYVSQAENCFCFEPVSQMNDAMNWAARRADTGLRILAPGEEWAASMTLRARSRTKKQ